ncbi:hypothetical protein [Spiroplasma endosymbiont of Diplazon laetatorius]|uniref:hypothetical protein n=1 Tax=Spiroplasma endosymbiont of Diplazon laetatorius TaxID=3066322 RepID=UPI0030CEF566
MFFVLEFTNIIVSGSSAEYGTYKVLVYTLGSSSLIFHILLNSLYLFKKQVKDGIASIELRAGFKTWKSYLIRVLIIFSTALVYIGITLGVSIILNATSIKDIKLFFNLQYSQVFFLAFLAFFSTLIMTVAMILFKTSMATMFAMVYMITIALAPITASFSYLMKEIEDNNYKTNIRIISGANFYNQFKSNENLFNDKGENDESITNSAINDYVEKALTPIANEKEGNYSAYNKSGNEIEGFSLRHNVKYNNLQTSKNIENSKSSTILTRNLGLGQVYYNYNVFGEEKYANKDYLLEGTPIWNVLEPINEYVYDNRYKLNATNKGEISSIFVKQPKYSWWSKVDSKNININNFVNEISSGLPEQRELLKLIEKFYNSYKNIFPTFDKRGSSWGWDEQKSAAYNDILDSALLDSTRDPISSYYGDLNFYSWEEFYTNNNSNSYYSSSFNFNQVSDGEKGQRKELYKNKVWSEQNNEVINKNNEMAQVYNDFPELTIINQLIISLWRMAMDFDIFRTGELDSSLYEYYNTTVASNSLKTDVFRHFAAMSTGLFSDALYNDLFNVSNATFYQGQFYTIKNIFDFENFSYTNKAKNVAMQPAYQNIKIKTKKQFLIPLAYFVYIVLISPLGYVGYIIFNKKAKL